MRVPRYFASKNCARPVALIMFNSFMAAQIRGVLASFVKLFDTFGALGSIEQS
jgi:hypothetical protein